MTSRTDSHHNVAVIKLHCSLGQVGNWKTVIQNILAAQNFVNFNILLHKFFIFGLFCIFEVCLPCMISFICQTHAHQFYAAKCACFTVHQSITHELLFITNLYESILTIVYLSNHTVTVSCSLNLTLNYSVAVMMSSELPEVGNIMSLYKA